MAHSTDIDSSTLGMYSESRQMNENHIKKCVLPAGVGEKLKLMKQINDSLRALNKD